jgi:hypothetical protein
MQVQSSRKSATIILNGSNHVSFENAGNGAGEYDTVTGLFLIYLSVGDYIQIKLYHNNGASQSARTDSYLQIYKLI